MRLVDVATVGAFISDAIVIMTSNLGSDNFKKFEKPLVWHQTAGDFQQLK